MAQFARPDGDRLIESGIGKYPGSGDFYEEVDEAIANDDTDYIWKSDTANASAWFYTTDVSDPGVGTGHIIRIRAKSLNGGGQGERLILSIYEGNTLIAGSPNLTVNRGSYTTLEYTLTELEANAITDYTNLSFRVYFYTIGTGETIRVTWVELEVPDAGGIIELAGSLAGQSALSAQYLELLMEILGVTAGQSNLPATPLKKAFNIVGSLTGQSGVDGAIGLFKLLAGEISGLSNLPDADMKLLMELLGTCNGQAGTLVNLGVAYSVLGSISGQSGETAVLKAIKKIIGSLDAQSGLTGDLSVEAVILLEGNIGGYSGVLATPLEVLMKITGTVDAQSGMDGEIKLTMELIGNIGGLSTADATLKAIRGLAGDVDALSSLSGTLQSIAYLLGTVTGTSDVDGALKVTLQLVGVIDGQSVVLGELTQIVSTLIGLTKISSMMSDMLTKITTEDDDLITEIWTVM